MSEANQLKQAIVIAQADHKKKTDKSMSFNLIMTLFVKRLIDFTISLLALIVLSPLFIFLVLIIKIDTKGKAFFTQKRLGKNGKVFVLLKFRTMLDNAEFIGDGLAVGSQNDPRITKTGKVLRMTSLDELPQLINILVGDMSIVGPRPPVTYFPYDGYDAYPSWAQKRFLLRPGLTGKTQVSVRNSVSWDERIIIDNQYIDELSIGNDLKIIAKTFLRLIKPQNIYGMNKNL